MPSKIKICFFVGYFPIYSGGAEYQAYLLANSLDRSKYDIFFISMGGNKNGKYIIDGYRIYFLKSNKILMKLGRCHCIYFFKIFKILSIERPQVVYQRIANSTTGLLSYLSNRLKFRFILASSSDKNFEKKIFRGIRNILSNIDDYLRIYGIYNTNSIFVQSNYQKRVLKENFGKISYLLPNFHPTPKKTVIKKRCPITVVWISNIKRLKQPQIFVALAKEFQNYKNVKFVMIGKPARSIWQYDIEKRIKELKNLNYLKKQNNNRINEILCESHILVNTSQYEGFPNTFIQAWMREIPVISLNVDPDDILKKNKIGFHSRSFEQMVLDLRKLIEGKKLRMEMGKRARKYALNNHSMANAKIIIDFIERNSIENNLARI